MLTECARLLLVDRKTQRFINIDMSSGGYPYEVDYPYQARIWDSKKEALAYASHWPNRFKLYYVQMSVKEVEE